MILATRACSLNEFLMKIVRSTISSLLLSFLYPVSSLRLLSHSRPAGGMSKIKNSFTLYAAITAVKPNSSILSFSSFRPNRRNRLNRTPDRTGQPAMPSPILSPLNFFLRLAHPVRNNENPNQFLDSHAPFPRQILQIQENTTI